MVFFKAGLLGKQFFEWDKVDDIPESVCFQDLLRDGMRESSVPSGYAGKQAFFIYKIGVQEPEKGIDQDGKRTEEGMHPEIGAENGAEDGTGKEEQDHGAMHPEF
jgi:hypothetical protein